MSNASHPTYLPPMGENPPPMDGRWILARIKDLPPSYSSRPWVIVTRSDEGFVDDWGENMFEIEKIEAWLPLPEPQPEPTGWTAPAGTIMVERGYILESKWRGWMVHIIRPDGSFDDREPWLYNDDEEAEADAKADWYVQLYGLTLQKSRNELPIPESKIVYLADVKGRPH